VAVRLLFRLSVAGSAVALLPPWHWLLEVNTSASVYYLLANLLALGVGALRPQWLGCGRRVWLALVLLVLSGAHVRPLVVFLLPRPEVPSGATFSLLYANVNTGRGEPTRLGALIRKHQPDLIAMLEVNERWLGALDLGGRYSHHRSVPREDNFGLAIYSRLPLVGETTTTVGEGLPPVVVTGFEVVPGRSVRLALLHAVPPLSNEALHSNTLLLRRVVTPLRHEPGPLLVVGDFNATPASRFYQRFVSGGGLLPAGVGSGYRASWNALVPFPRLMIDHVLYRGSIGAGVHARDTWQEEPVADELPDLAVTDFRRLSPFGSDHYPLLVHFTLSPAGSQDG